MIERKTHAEIVAEIRFHGQQNIDAEKDKPEFGILTMEGRIASNYADELEAAHKRELDELRKQVGNAAKLREALKALFDLCMIPRPRCMAVCKPCIDGDGYSPDSEWCAKCVKMKKKCMAIHNALAALSAPPRNCDVGTAEDQEARFDGFCMAHKEIKEPGLKGCSENCPFVMKGFCDLHWAQMPYEEKEGNAK